MGGKWVLDSLNVVYIWEDLCECRSTYPALTLNLTERLSDPVYYVPFEALEQGPAKISVEEASERGCRIGKLSCEHRTTDVAIFEEGPLKGLAKIAIDGIGKRTPTAFTLR